MSSLCARQVDLLKLNKRFGVAKSASVPGACALSGSYPNNGSEGGGLHWERAGCGVRDDYDPGLSPLVNCGIVLLCSPLLCQPAKFLLFSSLHRPQLLHFQAQRLGSLPASLVTRRVSDMVPDCSTFTLDTGTSFVSGACLDSNECPADRSSARRPFVKVVGGQTQQGGCSLRRSKDAQDANREHGDSTNTSREQAACQESEVPSQQEQRCCEPVARNQPSFSTSSSPPLPGRRAEQQACMGSSRHALRGKASSCHNAAAQVAQSSHSLAACRLGCGQTQLPDVCAQGTFSDNNPVPLGEVCAGHRSKAGSVGGRVVAWKA